MFLQTLSGLHEPTGVGVITPVTKAANRARKTFWYNEDIEVLGNKQPTITVPSHPTTSFPYGKQRLSLKHFKVWQSTQVKRVSWTPKSLLWLNVTEL